MPDKTNRPFGKAELRRLVDLSPAVHYVAGLPGNYGATFISESVRNQMGYEPDQFTQDPEFWERRIHPDDRSRVFANVQKVFEHGRHIHEYRFLHADGSYRWMHDEHNLVRDEAGNPIEIVGSWLDITERKKMEEALQQAHDELENRVTERTTALRLTEKRLKAAQRISKGGSWERNIATGDVWWSDELYRLHGEDPETFDPTYEVFIDRVHPEDRSRVQELMKAAWRDHEPYSVETRVILPDGTQKWMYSNVEITCDEKGQPSWMTGTTRDVTESRELQRALEESETRARALLNANPDLIFRISREGVYLDFHAVDETRLAASPDEIIGHNMADIFDPGFVREQQAHIDKALDTGEVQLWQYQIPVKGDIRNHEARFLRSGTNEVVLIIQDITEQTRLEREVISIGEDERKRIGNDLHDGLGQELTAVSLALQALSLKLERENSPHALTAQHLTASAQRMISETRRFARQLSPVFSGEFGLSDALEALTKEVMEYSDVECHARCLGDSDAVDSETSIHLYRIAQESINNAVRHSGARNIQVEYGCAEGSIFLEVLDDGTGIPTREHRADGIGLRSMRYRTRMLRGRLEVGPRSHGGTRVICSCPAPPA